IKSNPTSKVYKSPQPKYPGQLKYNKIQVRSTSRKSPIFTSWLQTTTFSNSTLNCNSNLALATST
ncbi:hypothetical protein LINPERPRIM_LOCUS42799, partial [Linum perenne]